MSGVTQPIDAATPVSADTTPVSTEPDKVSHGHSNHMMHGNDLALFGSVICSDL